MIREELADQLERDADSGDFGFGAAVAPFREAAAELRKRCEWTTTEGDSTWESRCGNEFTLGGNGPLEEGMRFCCFCGGTLAERITNIAGEELP